MPYPRTQQRRIYKYNSVAISASFSFFFSFLSFLFYCIAILVNTEQILLEVFGEIAVIFGSP